MCTLQPAHIKQYQEQLNLNKYPENLKQPYTNPALQQYIPKETQLHYMQKESQMHNYMQQKEQYSQYFPKYNVQHHQYQRPYTDSNNFLAHLNKIDPQMAQAIMNDPHLRDPHLRDPHLRDSQLSMYHSLDQNRPYQNQRMYRTPTIHNNPNFGHRSVHQSYNQGYNFKSNLPGSSDPYRIQQYQSSIPKFPLEQPLRNTSPRRSYQENLPFNYMSMSPKVSPSYQTCNQLEYAQHYQHRRPPHIQSDYYQQKNSFIENEINDSATTKSNSLKQYLENWNDEEMSSNINELAVRIFVTTIQNFLIIFWFFRYQMQD